MIIKKRDSQKGFISILTVLGIGLFVFGMSLAIYNGTVKQLLSNRNTVYGDLAFYTAESAMSEATYQVLNSAEGAYTVNTMPQLNNITPIITITKPWCYETIITGNANMKNINRQVSEHLETSPNCLPFSYGIFTPGVLALGGNSMVVSVDPTKGDIFATHGVFCCPKCPSECIKEGSYTGDAILGETPPAIPTLEDFRELYKKAADDNHTYFTSTENAKTYIDNKTKNGETVQGIIFVDNSDELIINNEKTQLIGSLWVTGNLTIRGGNYTASHGYAVMVVEGNRLEAHGTPIINGVVYVKGTINSDIIGGITVNGTIISEGDININGNVTVNYDPTILASWRDMAGFGIGNDPFQPVLWEEK